MITAFIIVAGILFFFLAVIWNGRDDFFNLLLKVFFGLMAVWSLICALLRFGFHQ